MIAVNLGRIHDEYFRYLLPADCDNTYGESNYDAFV